jgi:RHS repeat-associated protein
VKERLSYDAWGLRCHPDGTPDPAGAISSQSSRGFTGHEHLNEVGLIHMNGRVYDPLLARFGTPDPMTESPFSTQGGTATPTSATGVSAPRRRTAAADPWASTPLVQPDIGAMSPTTKSESASPAGASGVDLLVALADRATHLARAPRSRHCWRSQQRWGMP